MASMASTTLRTRFGGLYGLGVDAKVAAQPELALLEHVERLHGRHARAQLRERVAVLHRQHVGVGGRDLAELDEGVAQVLQDVHRHLGREPVAVVVVLEDGHDLLAARAVVDLVLGLRARISERLYKVCPGMSPSSLTRYALAERKKLQINT